MNNWSGRPGASARAFPSETLIRMLGRNTTAERRREQTALDAGCGNGRNTVALVALGFRRVIAVDPLPEMLDAARAAVFSNGAGGAVLDTRRGALPALPCDNDAIDIAVCWGTLFQLGGRAATQTALRELARVVAPNGLLISDWRTPDDALTQHVDRQIEEDTLRLARSAPSKLGGMVYSFWSAAQITGFHAAAGFEITTLERVEVRDVRAGVAHSWWSLCAQRLKN